MNLVDDASSTTLCRMGEQETTRAAVGVLRAWMEKYEVPRALYTDWKNVYLRGPTAKKYLDGTPATTQFGRMCERLGIKIIAAGSPEAKGRVELRRKKTTSYAEVTKNIRKGTFLLHVSRGHF